MPRALLAVLLLVLAYGFWASAAFTEIAAGIALFLFGMLSLEGGFRAFTGGALQNALSRFTDRLWKSIAFGIVTTSVMQSSTLVSLVTISFVSAEMIRLAGGIGIIMGANLGTTTGAWLIAGLGLRVEIAAYAMPILVFGIILRLQAKRSVRGLGSILLGVGFLFLGIHYMREGFEALQQTFDLTAYALPGWPGVMLFTIVGMLITVIMQSSHATLLVIITALAAGQVTYENALALAIGANLGSAITTAAGGMAANLGGKRLAVAHVLFNVMTAVIAIALIRQMAWAVDTLAGVLGIAEGAHALKLALFHSLFNLLGVVLLAPFVAQFERLLIRHVRFAAPPATQPMFLYPEALNTPTTAVAAARKEIGHLYDNATDLIIHGLGLRREAVYSSTSLAEGIRHSRRAAPLDVDDAYETNVKGLYSAIVEFIAHVQGRELDGRWVAPLNELQRAGRNIVEAVKALKHLQKNLTRHAASPNPSVREHYDAIRVQLAKLLREIEELRGEAPGAAASLSLDSLRLELETASRKRSDAISRMIRNQQVSPHIATSMMNDEGYAATIGTNLIEAARTLLLSDDPAERVTEEQLALDEQELELIAGGVRRPAPPSKPGD